MAAGEGQQVMALISKRLRSLRKKNKRIAEMEESVSQGKTLNKDQEEILRSKPLVTALIEELENLRLPLPPPSAAVSEEISLPAQKQKQKTRKKEDVTAKKDIEDCTISDALKACDEVSNEDNTSSVPSRKSRRKRQSKQKKEDVTSKKDIEDCTISDGQNTLQPKTRKEEEEDVTAKKDIEEDATAKKDIEEDVTSKKDIEEDVTAKKDTEGCTTSDGLNPCEVSNEDDTFTVVCNKKRRKRQSKQRTRN